MLSANSTIRLDKFCGPGAFRLALAMAVLLHHSVGFISCGAPAVYLFFTLSGYWVTLLWDRKYSELQHPILIFWLSRWWRVVPLLVTFTLLAAYIHPQAETVTYTNNLIYWCRVLAVLGIAGQPTPLPVVWSLDVEAQFYAIAPLLFLIATFRPRFELLVLFISIALGYVFLASGSASTAVNLAQFSAFFLCGMLHARGKLMWAAKSGMRYTIPVVLVLVLSIATLPATRLLLTNYTGEWSDETVQHQNLLMFTLGLLLVPIALASVHWKAGKLDRAIGDTAYPLYLCHLIPLAFYQQHEFSNATDKAIGLLSAWVAVGTLTFLGYLIIDRPSENLRKRFLISRNKSGLQ